MAKSDQSFGNQRPRLRSERAIVGSGGLGQSQVVYLVQARQQGDQVPTSQAGMDLRRRAAVAGVQGDPDQGAGLPAEAPTLFPSHRLHGGPGGGGEPNGDRSPAWGLRFVAVGHLMASYFEKR